MASKPWLELTPEKIAEIEAKVRELVVEAVKNPYRPADPALYDEYLPGHYGQVQTIFLYAYADHSEAPAWYCRLGEQEWTIRKLGDTYRAESHGHARSIGDRLEKEFVGEKGRLAYYEYWSRSADPKRGFYFAGRDRIYRGR
jgi:hypothetical protein